MTDLNCKSASSIEHSLMRIFGVNKEELDKRLKLFRCIKGLSLRQAGREVVKDFQRSIDEPLNVAWFHGTCLTQPSIDSIYSNGLLTRSEMSEPIKSMLTDLSEDIEPKGSKQPHNSVVNKRNQGNEGPFGYLINLNLTSDYDNDYTVSFESIQDYAVEVVGKDSSEQLIERYKEKCVMCDVIFECSLELDKSYCEGEKGLSELENEVINDAAGVLLYLRMNKTIVTSELFVFEANGTKILNEQILEIVRTPREVQPTQNSVDIPLQDIISLEVPKGYQQ